MLLNKTLVQLLTSCDLSIFVTNKLTAVILFCGERLLFANASSSKSQFRLTNIYNCEHFQLIAPTECKTTVVHFQAFRIKRIEDEAIQNMKVYFINHTLDN